MEFLHLLFITNFFELLAAILATVFYKKYAASKEKYFVYFLWYVVIGESIGTIFAWVFSIGNTWIYILISFINFLFYFFWYKSILENKKYKKIITLFTILFILIAVVDFSTQSWKQNHVMTYISGSIIIVITSFMYFSELLNSNEVLYIKNKLSFWIATGLLLFNVGMVPLIIFSETFNAHNELRIVIVVSLNVILYTCYSLGFIWCKKKVN